MSKVFRFKEFAVHQREDVFKVGTDGVLLGSWVEASSAKKILDVGTGTGMIALMMAQRFPNAEIHGAELDENSAKLAAKNFSESNWADRLRVYHLDIREAGDEFSSNKYNHILSNPPFFSAGTLPSGESRINARHQSSLTFSDLLTFSAGALSTHGKLSVVIPYDHASLFKDAMKSCHFELARETIVRTKKEKRPSRILWELVRENTIVSKTNIQKSELVMQLENRNEYTPRYLAMVQPFYLNL